MKVISSFFGEPLELEEVEVHYSSDGLGRASIVKRPDGLLCIYKHWKASDEMHRLLTGSEVGVPRWPDDKTPPGVLYKDLDPEIGLYGGLDEARREIFALLNSHSAQTES